MRIYHNLFKSNQRAAGLKAFKPAANGRYLMCKPLPDYLHLLTKSTFILLSVNADMDYRIFNVRTRSFLCVGIGMGGWIHQQRVSTTFFITKNHNFSCAPDGARTRVTDVIES